MAKKKESQKIVSIHGGELKPEYGNDKEYLEHLRSIMTPPDRLELDDLNDAIEISKTTKRLSVYSSLVNARKALYDKYDVGADDTVTVTWDDAAISEASGA